MRQCTLITLNRNITIQADSQFYAVNAFVGEWVQHVNSETAQYRITQVIGPKSLVIKNNQPLVLVKKSTIVSQQEL